MTTQTDTAPLSARLRAYGDSHLKGCPQVITEAADALDALSARVAELEAENKRLKIECVSWKSLYERFAGHLRRAYNVAVEAGGSPRHGEFDTAEAIADVVGSRDDWKARATQAEAERDALNGRLAAVREDYANVMVAIGAESIADVPAMVASLQDALSASQAREAGMREALKCARPFLRLHGCPTEPVDAALSPAQPAQSPGIALAARLAGQPDATLDAELAAFARELAAGDVVTCSSWAPGETATIKEIVQGSEAVALFTNGGFWRVSQLARSAGLLTTETEVSNG